MLQRWVIRASFCESHRISSGLKFHFENLSTSTAQGWAKPALQKTWKIEGSIRRRENLLDIRRASEGCPVSQSRWLLRIEYLDLCSTTARSNHPKSEAREIIFKTTNSFCMSSSAARPSRVHTWNLSKWVKSESRFGIQKQQEKLKSKYLEK